MIQLYLMMSTALFFFAFFFLSFIVKKFGRPNKLRANLFKLQFTTI